jgi:hypothetical protein
LHSVDDLLRKNLEAFGERDAEKRRTVMSTIWGSVCSFFCWNSMSRPANPYDNATCESFLKTLKREEIRASTYGDFEDLRGRIEEFIERYYNVCRLHSALGYRSPEDFEKESQRESQRTSAAPVMTFFGD